MNSNKYITQTLLNNLVGMNYRGKAVIEARIMSYSECQEFTDVILVRYGQGEIHEKLFIHPAHVRYSYLTPERILLVERLGGGYDAEYNFTK